MEIDSIIIWIERKSHHTQEIYIYKMRIGINLRLCVCGINSICRPIAIYINERKCLFASFAFYVCLIGSVNFANATANLSLKCISLNHGEKRRKRRIRLAMNKIGFANFPLHSPSYHHNISYISQKVCKVYKVWHRFVSFLYCFIHIVRVT